MRPISSIYPAEPINMGGIVLDQALPIGRLQQVSPFLLIHHWNQILPGGNMQNELGVGPHPHRGFSPVTFIFKGELQHRDSRMNNSIVKAGGTQWMHAGLGIMHSERPTKELAEHGGEFELIQFWINDPAVHKMTQPKYYPLSKEETPLFISEDKKTKVYVVAGEFMNIKGPIEPLTPLLTVRFEFDEGAEYEFEVPESFNTLLYQLDGELMLNQSQPSKAKDLTFFASKKGVIKIKALKQTRAILLAGEPIDEPVVTYGPIVMNTQTEIMEALRDAQMGKMGILIED